MPLPLLFAIAALASQDPAVGHWQGYWVRHTDTLRVTMDIAPGDSASHYHASFSTDRLRVASVPFASAERDGSHIRMTLRGDATTLVFDGMLGADVIAGSLTEAGDTGSFVLRRAPPQQTALREDDVEFSNGAVRLSGTLILPSSKPPYPAIVMGHGSGGEGRFANRYLARRFAEAGIAALIFDKRGAGKSTGDWRTAGFEDLAADIAAGVALLRNRRDIRHDRIGLFGHSQGGTLLPLAAGASGAIAFVVASAASAVPTDSAERFSLRNATDYANLPADEAARANEYVVEVVRVAYHGAPRARLDSLALAFEAKSWRFPLPDSTSSYWSFSRRIAGYDPLGRWRAVQVPVLLLYGSTDQRVPAAASVQAIRDALAAGHHDRPTVCVYAGADHTERIRRPGDVWPRNADGYLEDMVAWLRVAAGVERGRPRDVRLSAACTRD
jgi:uncharacterized protein